MKPPAVLHVSPHPDDELIGAPAALMALRDAGHQIINLAVSLGRPADQERRRAEVEEACRRAGFHLDFAVPPIGISNSDDLAAAEVEIRRLVGRHLDTQPIALVVSPSPHDRHHGHEVVGRGVREALRERSQPPPWWAWGLWASLPFPTLYVPFDELRLEEITHALEAHAGEISRNDYRRLIVARGQANAVLGAELVFGFGERGRDAVYADLVTELLRDRDEWRLGRRRELDFADALDTVPTDPAGGWVDTLSPSQALMSPKRSAA